MNKYKAITVIFAALMAFLIATWLHMYQRPSDYQLEAVILNTLKNKNSLKLSDHFYDADVACFLQSYALPDKLPLLEREIETLKWTISGETGIGDHVWWVVLIENRKVKKLYRMHGNVRPDIHDGFACATAANGLLIPTRSDKYTYYFSVN